MFPRKVSRIYVEDVDMIMFCTKNPIPLIPVLDKIKVPILLDVTMTAYHEDIEPQVYNKPKIIEAMKVISERIGRENMTLRYDPIFLSKRYTVDYHIRAFERLCDLLEDVVGDIVISFLDEYKNVKKNKDLIGYRKIEEEEYERLATEFVRIAGEHNLRVHSCFEKGRLARYGLEEEACLSQKRALAMTGRKFRKWSARDCGCVEMADIGVYNTCSHRCRYCYANYSESKIDHNRLLHDPESSLLIGQLEPLDEIKRRKR